MGSFATNFRKIKAGIMKLYFFIICFILTSSLLLLTSCSSNRVITSRPAKKPLSDTAWIAMMDNPNTNYFEAVANFEAFWNDKRKPTEEGELFEKAEEGKDVEKTNNPDEPAVKYYFEYKKFKHWQNDIGPYVQPDGRILTMDEMIEIHKQQQKLIEKQKSKN